MPTRSPKEPEVATFVFQGTVQKTNSANMKSVAVNNQTTVVTVDQVVEAPTSLAKFGGTEITVQLTGSQKAQPGETMIFHCNGWIFGDSVAVQCVKLEAVKRTHAGLLSRGGDPIEHRRNQVVKKRFADADTVVSGTVALVQLPVDAGMSGAAGRRSLLRAAVEPAITGPISEHNPHWREAVISIDQKHKGGQGQSEMVIRFPASTDVRWYRAPKFTPGQQGFFMLHKTKVTKRPKVKKAAKGARTLLMATAKPEAEEVFTALHPEDFQPYSEPGGIKEIIDTGSDETEG
jgi:hypothetical protein